MASPGLIQNPMTLQDFANLKKWLMFGDIAELAKEHKISRSSAYKVINGKRKNFPFIEALYERAIENRARVAQLQERLNANRQVTKSKTK